PGNVRELANIVERLAILYAGTPVTAAHVREVLTVETSGAASRGMRRTPPSGFSDAVLPAAGAGEVALGDLLDEYERTVIQRALSVADGSIAEAARRLRTDRPNLYRRMRRLGILPAASSGDRERAEEA